MAKNLLSNEAIALFTRSMATMHAAGIQLDTAILLLARNASNTTLAQVCQQLYPLIVEGSSLASAMKQTKAFPRFACDMIHAGEESGRLEAVLYSLTTYYEEQNKLFQQIKRSIGYPAVLLVVMTLVLLFTSFIVIPIITNAYQAISDSLTTTSTSAIEIAQIVSWIMLGITAVATILAVIAAIAARTPQGQQKILQFLTTYPGTSSAMRDLAVSSLTAMMSTYLAAGVYEEDALRAVIPAVGHKQLKQRLQQASQLLNQPDESYTLGQALLAYQVIDEVHGQLLEVAAVTGTTDEQMNELSTTYFNKALDRLEQLISNVEPFLAAFLTLTICITLLAIMLPMVGMILGIS